MKKILTIGIVMAVLLIFTGCATADNGLFGYFATTDYVKKQLEEAKKVTDSELNSVKKDVSDMKALTGKVKDLLDEVSQTKQSTEELQKLAKSLESRLNNLPHETLVEIIKILENYLNETKSKTGK